MRYVHCQICHFCFSACCMILHTIQILKKEKWPLMHLRVSTMSSCFTIRTEVLINILRWLRDSWPPGSPLIFLPALRKGHKHMTYLTAESSWISFFNVWLPSIKGAVFIFRGTAEQQQIQDLCHSNMEVKRKPLLDVCCFVVGLSKSLKSF